MNLTDRYSGLPLWVWGVIGGGTIGAGYLFVSRYRAAKSTNTVVQPPGDGGPLIIPLAGPPGQSIQGKQGDKGDTGATGAAGAPGVVPPPSPPVQPASPPPPTGSTSGPSYVVQPGDNLTKIAQRFGLPNYMALYNANAQRIEEAAHSHGKSSSAGPEIGHWIWPGTMLQIPK